MKRRWIWLAVVVSIVGLLGTGCTRVEPGYEGIKINLHGEGRLDEDIQTVQGRVWLNPITQDVIKTPVFAQRYIWTAAVNEGSEDDESITFNSKEGTGLNADFAVTVQLREGQSRELYWNYRKDLGDWVDTVFRDTVRDHLNDVAGQMEVMDIVGPGKQKLMKAVTDAVYKRYEDLILLPQISIVGEIRVPDSVRDSINKVIEARNQAIEAETRVKQAEAEAKQKIATARGESERLRIEAEGQAKANIIVAKSITPALVQWQAIQKWEGKLPRVTGEVVPFIQVDGK